jgi:hypothetical protein
MNFEKSGSVNYHGNVAIFRVASRVSGWSGTVTYSDSKNHSHVHHLPLILDFADSIPIQNM